MMDVCPWWLGYFIDNPIRRWLINSERIFRPYVRPGMTVLDAGCGMGVNSIAIARLVGPAGVVIAADIQPRMLATLEKRAARAGVAGRIRTHLAQADSLGVSDPVDFALAFWMVHETPDPPRFLTQVRDCLRPGARFLLIEPRMHVTGADFERTLEAAGRAGLSNAGSVGVPISHAALLERS